MPRVKYPYAFQIEHLSILDENGQLDMEPEPDLPAGLLLRLHRDIEEAAGAFLGSATHILARKK